MAHIRRGKLLSLLILTTGLLSACGSETGILKPSHPIIVDQSVQTVSIQHAFPELLVAPSFSLSESTTLNPKLQTDSAFIKTVANRFGKSEPLMSKIVASANRYSYDDFPKRNDILAVIAVESSFNTKAHYRGSWGLMQIEAKSHKGKFVNLNDLTNVETNIRIGAALLRQYYSILNSSRSQAIEAYNVGIGNFLNGRRNHRYVSKVQLQYAYLNGI